MNEHKKYDIFISYSRRDLEEVTVFVEMLKARIPAIEIWMDLDGIEAADEFDEKIITAIDASSYVLFMVSNNSNSVGEGSSKWTKKELVYAKNTGKTVLPVLLKGALLNSWFLFEFGRVNFIDSSDSRQIDKFLKNLARWTGKELLKEQKTERRKELTSDEQLLLNEAEKIKRRTRLVKRLSLILVGIVIALVSIISLAFLVRNFQKVNAKENWSFDLIDTVAPYGLEVKYTESRIFYSHDKDENFNLYSLPYRLYLRLFRSGDRYYFYKIYIPSKIRIMDILTIPVTSIGSGALSRCYTLKSVRIPKSITNIGASAFEYCAQIKSIRIPNRVKSIGDSAFQMCFSLAKVTIPRSVESIGVSAFRSCTSLNQINFGGTMAEWHNISKGDGWNSFVPAKTVHCTDGDITL